MTAEYDYVNNFYINYSYDSAGNIQSKNQQHLDSYGYPYIGIYMISVWMGIESFSWWGFSWTVICGLASGAFAASSLRRAVQIVINISLSVASNICNYIRKTKKPSVEGIITEIVIGCIVGLVAGYVGGHGNGKLFKKASNSYVKNRYRATEKLY